MEKTLLLIKPSGVQRGLIGEVIKRIEQKGLKIVGLKMMQLDDAILEAHYAHLAQKSFFTFVKESMKASPIVALCIEGKDAVDVVHDMSGATNSRKAAPGTIRGDFSMSVAQNIVHSSDTIKTAAAEIDRFFKPEEIFDYTCSWFAYMYSQDEL